MTDRQKSTHPLHLLHLSVSFLSFKAKSFACSSPLSLSLSLCLVYESERLIFVQFFCSKLLVSCTQTVLCLAVTLLLSLPLLFHFCFSPSPFVPSLPLSLLHLPPRLFILCNATGSSWSPGLSSPSASSP